MAVFCLKCGAIRRPSEADLSYCAFCFASPFRSCRRWAVTEPSLAKQRAWAYAPAAPSKKKKAKDGKSPHARRWARKRKRVYERDGHRCVRCGSEKKLTLDHIVPRSKGGSNALDNLQTMCGPCNQRKADLIEPVAA